MKKTYLYIFITAILFPVIGLNAQNTVRSAINADQIQVRRESGRVIMDMNLHLNNIDLKSQEMIVLTPVLQSNDNINTYTFKPIVITGAKRDKALNRAMDFGSFEFDETPQIIIRRDKAQSVPLSLDLPYQPWLHNASLMFKEDRIGCACENEYSDQYSVLTPVLPPVFNPQYDMTYIVPPVEEVKRRSETHSARLNFELAKYKLLRNYKNNDEVLNEVDRVINEVRNDKDLTVTEFKVTGYASPEGNPQSNMTLSKNRALAFVNYLKDTYDIGASSISTDWKGEDWEGLKEVVNGLSIPDKAELLDILNEPNVTTRKNRLHQLSGGQTYRMLLRDYYPPLRRNEYTISYIARAFDIEEAKVLIRTKPQNLSLNEMFMVAKTYPQNSREYKEVFDIAGRLYPAHPVAQVNSAAIDIDNGMYDNAIQRLQNIDTPEAWNNLGIAYSHKKDYRRAEEYFRRAASAGLSSAATNAEQLAKLMQSQ